MAETLEKNPIETSLDDKIVKGTSFPTVTKEIDNLESGEEPKTVKERMHSDENYNKVMRIYWEVVDQDKDGRDIPTILQTTIQEFYVRYENYINEKWNLSKFPLYNDNKIGQEEIIKQIIEEVLMPIEYQKKRRENHMKKLVNIKNNIEKWYNTIKWKSYENLNNDREYKWALSEFIDEFVRLIGSDEPVEPENDGNNTDKDIIRYIQMEIGLMPDWKAWPIFVEHVYNFAIKHVEHEYNRRQDFKMRYNLAVNASKVWMLGHN